MKPAYYFYGNPYLPRSLTAARALAKTLAARGCAVYAEDSLAGQGVGKSAPEESWPEGVRALVAFGGDGTLLRAMPLAVRRGLPMLGVNSGTVGFLMDGSADDPEGTAELLLDENHRVDVFPLLDVAFEGRHYTAMNDLSLTRGEHPGVIGVMVEADGERVMDAHGDGVICATPLGATAYSLSAGGPVVRPDTPCLTVTPVAARELLLRPVVLSLDARIALTAHGRDRRRLQLAIDGQTLLPVTQEARVEVRLSEEKARIIRPKDHAFFTTLRRKQRIWNQYETEENAP